MRWCVGIEDTAIGVPIRHSGRTLDEYELTEHDRRFRDDLELAASLGVDGLRYGVPWYQANPAPGEYRWDLVAPMIEHAAGLGLTVIVDLVHYGVPEWLDDGFVDPRYPAAIAAYAGAFADRFGGLVRHYTPLNEPGVTAAFCGESGGWPPYRSGLDGWTAVTVAIADGMQRTIRALRAVQADAVIVHVESAKLVRPGGAATTTAVELAESRAWLPTDLLLGRVDVRHPMHAWLTEHGADADRLAMMVRDRVDIDVMGVNFYPQYSVRELIDVEGTPVEVVGGGSAEDMIALLKAFASRYGRPVAITETSYDGDDAARGRWLDESTRAVTRAVAEGVDVWAYTWWPLFDFVDWGISAGGFPFEDFRVRVEHADGTTTIESLPSPGLDADPDGGVGPWLRRMGLWRLEPAAGGGLERVETPVARSFRQIVAGRSTPG